MAHPSHFLGPLREFLELGDGFGHFGKFEQSPERIFCPIWKILIWNVCRQALMQWYQPASAEMLTVLIFKGDPISEASGYRNVHPGVYFLMKKIQKKVII